MTRRRFLLLSGALALALAAPVPAPVRAACNGFAVQVKPFAFETITVSTTAIGFTAATYKGGSYATVSVETAAIRVRADGTDPTSTVGEPYAADGKFEVCGAAALATFRAIRSGGSDATLQVHIYKGE